MAKSSNVTTVAGAKTNHDTCRKERLEIISQSLQKAIDQINHSYYILNRDSIGSLIRKSISFPKNNNSGNGSSGKGNNGKPHDIETRIALTLYHQWKRTATTDHQKNNPIDSDTQSPPVIITSDLGLSRELNSPRQLSNLIVPLLEEDFRNNPQWNISPDVRSQPSGILSMISLERSQMLRLAGRLPCPYCIQWCKGEKGLWWHQQQYHKVEHSSATAVAQATTISSGAMVLYVGPNTNSNSDGIASDCNVNNEQNGLQNIENSCPMECVRQGNLDGLREAVQKHGYKPSTTFDAKGATPLMWAAGGGHLHIVRYLIEDCECDPCQSQKGKRSFAGRTALHWAARNGHIDVVRYLMSLATISDRDQDHGRTAIPMHKLLEAKTQDGTTAFGWACWQRHLQVMECLYGYGCDIHALNSYGCSPVLWCSQGTNGNGLQALKWLRDKGCNLKLVNHNGHGVLHKSAQRGQRDVAEWLVEEECHSLFNSTAPTETFTIKTFLAMVGPDIEGYCPSDLAGMEGHQEFAMWLASIEIKVCKSLNCTPAYNIPHGFSSESNVSSDCIWEQYGGLRRIRLAVASSVV